jgi:hypothetical protein
MISSKGDKARDNFNQSGGEQNLTLIEKMRKGGGRRRGVRRARRKNQFFKKGRNT